MVGGGGLGVWIQLPTFDAESKSDKTPKSHYVGGWGWGRGGLGVWIQLPTFDADSNSVKVSKSHCGKGGGFSNSQLWMSTPNLLKSQSSNMLTPNLLKFQSPIVVGEGGFPTSNFGCQLQIC